jgi:sec-independent protein translocase protein TatA
MAALLQPVLFLLALSLTLPSCSLGGPEVAIIAVVILLMFGGSRLPKLMRGMGSGVHEFKKGLKEGETKEGEEGEEEEKTKKGEGGKE